MKRLVIFLVMLALVFAAVGVEAKNGERGKKFQKMFPFPPVPQIQVPNNNNYNDNYYYNDDYYYRNNRRSHSRCGWITFYDTYYDYYGNPVLVERQVWHCQGQQQ